MPITPLHFGPSALISLPLNRYIDIPIFILANVIVDIEPLMEMVFNLNYPLHGYAHTFLSGIIIGTIFGALGYYAFKPINWGMKLIALDYTKNLRKAVISGVLGIWLHVLIDSFLYKDINPFFPVNENPFYHLINPEIIYKACLISFLPVIIIYLIKVIRTNKRA